MISLVEATLITLTITCHLSRSWVAMSGSAKDKSDNSRVFAAFHLSVSSSRHCALQDSFCQTWCSRHKNIHHFSFLHDVMQAVKWPKSSRFFFDVLICDVVSVWDIPDLTVASHLNVSPEISSESPEFTSVQKVRDNKCAHKFDIWSHGDVIIIQPMMVTSLILRTKIGFKLAYVQVAPLYIYLYIINLRFIWGCMSGLRVGSTKLVSRVQIPDDAFVFS